MTEVRVTARGADRWRAGHPWIHRSEVRDGPGEPGLVRVRDPRGKFIGQALYSPASEIRLRLLEPTDRAVDRAWWRERLAACVARRAGIDATAWRVVHGEGDALPSLVVDRYDRWIVAQLLSAGLETVRADVIGALVDVLAPDGILFRHDTPVRRRERLPEETVVACGSVPEEIEVREGRVRYLAAPWTGQKTGAFLDQRENYAAAAEYACGDALDVFCYQGGFALHLAPRCKQVTGVDSSRPALEVADQNATLNRREIEWIEANAFDLLKDYAASNQQYDTVVLDPPAFAKTKRDLDSALRGYKELNLRALKMLRPGGVLVTCSCSYHVSQSTFREMLASAAVDAHRTLRLLEVRGQGKDHPVLLNVPETAYLKCVIGHVT